MSAITPQTELRLIKCPIESDNRNQMNFASKTAQYNYFNSLPHLTVDNFTYQRKDSVIRYPAHIDSILTYNYVMYQNESYTNKWFYAFITKMEYVNDNMTYITIKTDVFQTWQFDMVWKRSFIERQHVNDDVIGKYTLPENLETGPYKINSMVQDPLMGKNSLGYFLMTTLDLSGVGSKNPLDQASGGVYNGIYGGARYYRFSLENYGSIKAILQWVAKCGQLDGIIGMFMCPYWLSTGEGSEVQESDEPDNSDINIGKLTSCDGYVPKNKKLLTYPYSYLTVGNGGGDANIYRYELFSNANNCEFSIKSLLCPGGSIKLLPKNYNGVTLNRQEGLTLGKFPICSYNTDMYTNWLTQNSVNFAGGTWSRDELSGLGALSGIFGIGGSLFKGDVIGTASSSMNVFGNVGNALIEKKQHELIPNAVKGDINSGDVVTALGDNRFTFYRMSVRSDYARIIDDYFTMYGYQVNQVAIPNITGRTNWNFVKTIGANIEGDIPEDDMNELKSLFNNGITIWHNPSNYLDYSKSNAII